MLPVPATRTLISMTHVDRFGQEQHENHIGMQGVYVGKTTLLRFPSSEDNPGVDLFDDAYCRSLTVALLPSLLLAYRWRHVFASPKLTSLPEEENTLAWGGLLG